MVMEEVKIRGIKSDNRFFIMGENKLFPDLVWYQFSKIILPIKISIN
jgi:hypothetical protein